MRNSRSSGKTGRLLAASLISIGLIAAGCSNKKDEGSTNPTTESTSGGSTDTTTGGADTTAPETTAPAAKPVSGGTLVVSGEAEVANPWTPAAMQCDSYCQQRARSFYDPLIVIGEDLQPHGMLIESWTANADSTQFDFTLRSGITFTDGTPLDAAAVVKNLQVAGAGLLLGAALKDVGKNADGTMAIEATGDLTFTVKTGFNGDLTKPLSWPGFPNSMSTQWGLIASPTWLDKVAAEKAANNGVSESETKPVGTGPFIVESYAPRDKLVVK
ncbi:MAG: ABC transporter substrate-binding protein, partial [Ilumatobacteraceae bacterium]